MSRHRGISDEPPSFEDLRVQRLREATKPKPKNFDRRFGTPVFTPRWGDNLFICCGTIVTKD